MPLASSDQVSSIANSGHPWYLLERGCTRCGPKPGGSHWPGGKSGREESRVADSGNVRCGGFLSELRVSTGMNASGQAGVVSGPSEDCSRLTFFWEPCWLALSHVL